MKNSGKLAGHTIIETVVSMTIASIVFSLGFLTYLNVATSLDQEYRVFLQNEVNYHLDSLTSLYEVPEELDYVAFNGLEIHFEKEPYEQYDHVWLTQCLLTDSLQNEVISRKLLYKREIDDEEED
ncbi:MAG: hypothetical protein R8G66_20230 [Cytophagales bacterium]|nr:hypothetical protein [Cytophagales bacterium]